MLDILYARAASLHCKIQQLSPRSVDSVQNVLVFSETQVKRVVVWYMLVRKDLADGRKGDCVVLMANDTFLAVPHTLT